jgi:alkanesulfonate monooxygenase SsuD/methylene tetrahydromethanopterin reductase-like flavin-dependent oxidoreductase (luciferase family)
MKLSIYLFTSWDVSPESERTKMAELDTQLACARDCGFEGVWMAEHHAARRYFPPPLQLLPWIAARYPEFSLGTAILLAPLYHPLHLAEATAAVHLMTGGRLAVGVGAGFRAAEFDAFGVDRESRFKNLEVGVQTLKRLWAGEEVDFDRPPYHGKRCTLQATLEHPPTILWGVVTTASIEKAARLADGIIPPPSRGFDDQLSLMAEFDTVRGNPARAKPMIVDIALGRDRSEAMDRARVYLRNEWTSHRHGRASNPDQDLISRDAEAFDELVDNRALVGTPEYVVSRLHELQARGVNEFVLRLQHLGTPIEVVLEYIRGLGRSAYGSSA